MSKPLLRFLSHFADAFCRFFDSPQTASVRLICGNHSNAVVRHVFTITVFDALRRGARNDARTTDCILNALVHLCSKERPDNITQKCLLVMV